MTARRKKVLVALRPEQYERLTRIAAAQDVPLAILVRQAVDRWLHEQEQAPSQPVP